VCECVNVCVCVCTCGYVRACVGVRTRYPTRFVGG